MYALKTYDGWRSRDLGVGLGVSSPCTSHTQSITRPSEIARIIRSLPMEPASRSDVLDVLFGSCSRKPSGARQTTPHQQISPHSLHRLRAELETLNGIPRTILRAARRLGPLLLPLRYASPPPPHHRGLLTPRRPARPSRPRLPQDREELLQVGLRAAWRRVLTRIKPAAARKAT